MALVKKAKVAETSTTTGTGTYTLLGAVAGRQAFSVIGDGNTCHYHATDGTDWEDGEGTYTASGTTLARTTIFESTNGGAAVNWGAGTRTLTVVYPASKAVTTDGAETLSNKTLTAPVLGAATGTTLALGTTPSTTGVLRIPSQESIKSRNATDNADLALISAGGTDQVVIGGAGWGVNFNNEPLTNAYSLVVTNAITSGVAGSTVGKVVLKNATSGDITIQPPTGALGTVTLTAPATTGTIALTSDISAPSLTATYIGYGDGSNALTGTSDLAYAAATGILSVEKSQNSNAKVTVKNVNTGTAASSVIEVEGAGGNTLGVYKLGSGYTLSGLLAAGHGVIYNGLGELIISNNGTSDIKFTTSGTGTANEKFRIKDAGGVEVRNTLGVTVASFSNTGQFTSTAYTSGRIPYVTTGGLYTDGLGLTFNGTTLGGTGSVGMSVGQNSAKDHTFSNTTAGAAATVALGLINDTGNGAYFRKYSSAFTTSGLLAAYYGQLHNSQGGWLFTTSSSADFIWSRAGTATSNEVFRVHGTGAVVKGALAIPAGGTAATGLMFSSTANFGVFFGSGAPSLSAAKGSLYLRSDGSGTTDRAYINTDGSTAWTALTTVG